MEIFIKPEKTYFKFIIYLNILNNLGIFIYYTNINLFIKKKHNKIILTNFIILKFIYLLL